MNPVRKLKLKLDDLSIESFEVHPRQQTARGTVAANESEEPGEFTIGGEETGELDGVDVKPSRRIWDCYVSFIIVLCQ